MIQHKLNTTWGIEHTSDEGQWHRGQTDIGAPRRREDEKNKGRQDITKRCYKLKQNSEICNKPII